VGHAAGGYFMLNMAGQGIGVALDIAKYGLNEQDVQALAGLGMLTFVGFGENVPEARFNIGQNYDRRLGGLDKSISGSHGELTWANGRIQYKDTSLFGTAILKGNELVKLDRGKTIDLQEGDEIYIGGIRKEGANNKYEIANNARARYVVEGNLLHLEMREDLAKWDSWTRQDGPIGHIDVAGQVETRLQARDGQALGRTGLEERFGQNAARAGLPVSEREMKEHLKKQFPEGEQNGNGGSARETTKGFVQVDNTRNRGDFGPKVHIAVPSLGNASYAAISAKVADMLGQMNRELEAQGIIPPTFKIGNNRENFSGDQTGKNITVYFSDVKAYGRALPHLHRISEYLTEAAESLGFKGGERECIEFRVAEQRNEGKAVGKLNRDAEWEVAEFITMGVRQHDATRPLIISRRDVEEFKSMLPDHGERAQIDRILADRRLNPEAGMEFVGMLNDKERASVLDAARKDDPALKGGYLLFSDEFLRNNSTSLMNRMMSYLYMEGKVSAMASF